MPINMPLTNKITIDSVKNVKFNILQASYGQYNIEQRIAKGINNVQDFWDIVWNYLTQDEAETVESALKSTYATDYILWTPCKETIQKHYRIDGGINKSFNSDKTVKITVKIYQIFDYINEPFIYPTIPVDKNTLLYQTKIEISTSKDISLAKVSANFYNNYKQEMPIGLNSIRDVWTIKWAGLTPTEVLAIEDSLIKSIYDKRIYWQPQGELDEKSFFSSGYTRSYLSSILNSPGYFAIATELVEYHGLTAESPGIGV